MESKKYNLETADEFLLKEYESAQKLTCHVDDMRSKLTQFFITLGGVALAAISVLTKKDMDPVLFGAPWWGVASFAVFGCAVLGVLFVLIIAKLRRVQIEHFHITNNIREYFLERHENSDKVLGIVMLSKKTIPKPTRNSGSYYWVLLIIVLTSILFAIATFLLSVNLAEIEPSKYISFALSIIVFAVSIFFLDLLYIKNAVFDPKVKITILE